jgi:3-phytase
VLALGPDRVLALERGFVRTADRRAFNVVRLFDVSLAGADDVSAIPSLAGARVRPLQKALVADLDETRSLLGPELGLLANFEALCSGPVLPDGSRTLLLVSDNNFSPAQRMAFVLLRLDVH